MNNRQKFSNWLGNVFRQKWWKFLGILLLLYVIVVGFLVPLGPGISIVFPEKVNVGEETNITLVAQNAHIADNKESTSVWLHYNKKFYCTEDLTTDGEQISFDFTASSIIPDTSDYILMDVIINNDYDGTFAIMEKLMVLKEGNLTYALDACEPDVKTDQAQYINFPNQNILEESTRNLLYHVPMWFGMVLILLFSLVCSISYLNNGDLKMDMYADLGVKVGLFYGILGLTTGMMWANYTWGSPWPNDPKLNGAAIAVLIYCAYLILRGSIKDEISRAKVSGVYSIFAYVLYLSFIFVIPRMMDSLHPGNGGNPAFSDYDLDNTLRAFFYPAVIGWTIIGFWLLALLSRYILAKKKTEELC